MNKRSVFVLAAQGVVIIGIVALFVSSRPQLKNPISGAIVSDNFNFNFENADSILIADNIDFNNAMLINETASVFLETGAYYWKVRKGVKESSVERFFVEGKNVSLSELISNEIREENGR